MIPRLHAATSPAARRAALVAAVAVLTIGAGLTQADAAKRRAPVETQRGPNVSYQAGPRTRIYVTKRSWLDAGTEVLPGERKFTDYAYPPAIGYPSFARENLNRPIDRQPLSTPSDLGGYPERFPLY